MPQGQASQELYRQGDIKSLDWLTEDNTVEEILALDCLEYLPAKVVELALTNWTQKLVSGGVLKILVPDCHMVTQAFYQGQFNLREYSQIIFGTQEGNDNRLSVIDAVTLFNILQKAGLTILLKRYEGVTIYAEATK